MNMEHSSSVKSEQIERIDQKDDLSTFIQMRSKAKSHVISQIMSERHD